MFKSFDKLTPQQKVTAANMDIMKHSRHCALTGVIMLGNTVIDNSPTAATDGLNVHYGREFLNGLNRKQVRYLVLHENYHKGFLHCVLPEYKRLSKKYPTLSNQAMDYVINLLIEDADPDFVERPIEELCYDERFKNMSFMQVLKLLIRECEEQGGDPTEPTDEGGQFDEHIPGEDDAEKQQEITKEVERALRQGEFMARKLAGKDSAGKDIFGLSEDRQTDWIRAMQDWVCEVCAGDDDSRMFPPNKRMLPQGIIMPSHYSETVGELVIACDTSGSMEEYYGLLFGEVARICEQAKPDKVHVIWWDTKVCAAQEFLPHQYEDIAKLLKPKGGGGTNAQCVVNYMEDKEIKPKAMVWLTDGYIGSEPRNDVPALWGVVDNDSFVPRNGKLLRIKPNL
jgi:predicted metal-dependent peptidase